MLFNPLLNTSAATASMKPVADFVTSPNQTALKAIVAQTNGWWEAYTTFLGKLDSTFHVAVLITHIVPLQVGAGVGVAISSRLIPSANFAPGEKAQELLTAMKNGMVSAGNNVNVNGLGML